MSSPTPEGGLGPALLDFLARVPSPERRAGLLGCLPRLPLESPVDLYRVAAEQERDPDLRAALHGIVEEASQAAAADLPSIASRRLAPRR